MNNQFPRFSAIAAGFVAIYFLTRLPFLHHTLIEEEGCFAKILLFDLKPPSYLILGRFDGQEIFCPMNHPVAMYHLMHAWGWIPRHLVDPTIPGNAVTAATRIAFSLFQLTVWIALLGAVVGAIGKAGKKLWPFFLLIFAVSCTPLAVSSSIEAQVDGSVGVLMVGALSISLFVFGSRERLRALDALALFGAALFMGLGKQEWSIGLLVAAIASLPFLLGSKNGRPTHRKVLAIATLGILVGNVLSYLWFPGDYLGGWDQIRQFSQHRSVLAQGFTELLHVNLVRAPDIFACIVMAFASGWLVFREVRRGESRNLLLSFFAFACFGEFFFSTYSTDARYFAPSQIALAVALIALLMDLEMSAIRKVVLPVATLFLICGASFLGWAKYKDVSITLGQGLPLSKLSRLPDVRGQDCVPAAFVGLTFNRMDYSFIGSSMQREDQKRIVEQHGKKLCAENPEDL